MLAAFVTLRLHIFDRWLALCHGVSNSSFPETHNSAHKVNECLLSNARKTEISPIWWTGEGGAGHTLAKLTLAS
jgi:hypothetical protein